MDLFCLMFFFGFFPFEFGFCSITLPSVQRNLCITHVTCAQCIQSHPSCAWCSSNGFSDNDDKVRCNFYESLILEGCDPKSIYFPVSDVNITQSEEFADQNLSTDLAVQLKPKRISLKLRLNDTQSFISEFKQAVDYPVDLYYLMDLSASMKEAKNKLSLAGGDLMDEMKKMTKNFRYGFGSFVDKVEMPYTSSAEEKYVVYMLMTIFSYKCLPEF